MNDYYKMIYVYPNQELPEQYNEYLRFDGAEIMFVIPEQEIFNSLFERISHTTEKHTKEIRERRMDLIFKVRKPTRERDLIVYR